MTYSIFGEGSRPTIELPGTTAGNSSLFRGYCVEKEMHVHARQLFGIFISFVFNNITILIVNGDIVDAHIESAWWDSCGRC